MSGRREVPAEQPPFEKVAPASHGNAFAALAAELPGGFGADARVEDYLDHVTGPLVGIAPFETRLQLRAEAQAHIEGLVGGYLQQGLSQEAATERALRDFGEPWQIGEAYLQEWLLGADTWPSERRSRFCFTAAFAWFGLAATFALMLLEQHLANPASDGLLFALLLEAILAPFAAGCLTGITAPRNPLPAVRAVVVALAAHALITAELLLPHPEGLALVAWEVVFWLPGGCVSAVITAATVRQIRRQRYWRRRREEGALA